MFTVFIQRTPNKNVKILLYHAQKRFKKKDKNPPKITHIDRAQEYFDTAYPPVYGSRWPSIRLALLSKPKYVALINNFANYEETVERFQELGAVDIRHIYSYHVERMKAKQQDYHDVYVGQTESSKAVDDGEQQPIRPSLIELDDEELAAREKRVPMSRYPEEYRQRILARGVGEGGAGLNLDFANRVLSPSEVGPGGVEGGNSGLMMDYVPATKLKGLENWIEETDVFHQASNGDADIGLKMEIQREPVDLPETLKIFSFSKGDISEFPHPKMDHKLGVLDHYCMDGGSLLPVLALGIKPGHLVLDICAAPGGKSLLALQTLLPSVVVSNDRSESRIKRIKGVMKQFIPRGLSIMEDTSVITMRDGCQFGEHDAYDRVLVDAPCLTDRHVLHNSDNSIFKPTRTKERLNLPELQSQLLVSGLEAVRPGGCVIYSTCTLSPLQNDGVVHLALSKIWQKTTIECAVVDMSYAVRPLRFMYRFGGNLGLRYGQVVLPSLLSNFGPMYFAKIKRLK